jgi:ketosteroid isomerase-like protein
MREQMLRSQNKVSEEGIQMQTEEPNVLRVERRFFNALIEENSADLDQLLSEDFLLIDVLSGAEINKSTLLAAVSSDQLKFDNINPLDSHIRFYNGTAVVTGTTKMNGRFADAPFGIFSRYTHVYSKQQDEWHLVAAQGTRITSAE